MLGIRVPTIVYKSSFVSVIGEKKVFIVSKIILLQIIYSYYIVGIILFLRVKVHIMTYEYRT